MLFTMRSTLSFWILSAVVCLGRSHHHLGHGQDTAADEDSNALSLVSSANREFAFNLYRKLSTHPESKGKNVFYSPRSVSLALAALAVGARGDTHRQLFDGLGFNSSLLQQTDVDRAFRTALRNETSSSQDTSEGTAAFLDRKFQPNPDFLQVLKESYSTEAFNVEFAKKQESLDTINGYVSGKTGGKIDKLLDSVEDDVAMYLVSYIYFKGKWKTPFDPTRTRKENFTVDENNKVLVDMMSTEEFVDIYQDLGLNTKVLHLPFNSTYSMVLLLPDNMEELEKTICPVHVTKWLKWTKPSDVSKVSVLVPGAGLGRLAWEVARLGYTCQGNEWSLFMLFSSNFVLNRCEKENALTLFPWIHQFSNNKKSSDQTRSVTFPDVNPQGLPPDSDFSMVAGDFVEVYTEPVSWDCVATCFFIDTAHNVIEYVETIWKILKPGGVWINLGPLLYHYENMANELSVELSYEDIRTAMVKFGFHLEVEKESLQTTYTENSRSMLRYVYDCVFFVARKPGDRFSDGRGDDDRHWKSPLPAKTPRREGPDSLT